MTRRRRQRRPSQYTKAREADTFQVQEVQGPQLPYQEPRVARVELTADLTEKYLGRGLIGFGPSLEVLSNRSGDALLQEHGYDLYRRMSMDSEIDASMDVLVQASSSSSIVVIPPLTPDDKDYKLAQELADFVNWTFRQFDLDNWRREMTRQMLTFGNSCSEVDWDYCTYGDWVDHLVIKDLRLQRPEDYGYIVDRWGHVYGVAPLGQAMGMTFPLGNIIPLDSAQILRNLEGAVPRYKLTVWVWEKKGTDPRGTSILIPAYIPWWAKQRAIEEWSCWLGRYAQPSIWATPGPNAVPVCITDANGNQVVTQPTESLLNALLQFKSASVLALPYGSEVNLLEAKGLADPFIDSIKAFNTEITRAILGQHLATAEGDNQSRAAADVHALVLRIFINSLRRFIAASIQRDLIKPLIEGNYGDVGHLMPIVDLGDGDGWAPTVTEIAVLMQSGYFTVDQLPKLDRILGIPVRETNEPAGPAAATAYYKAITDAQDGVPPASKPGKKA